MAIAIASRAGTARTVPNSFAADMVIMPLNDIDCHNYNASHSANVATQRQHSAFIIAKVVSIHHNSRGAKMNAEIVKRPLLIAQGKFFYLIPLDNKLFLAAMDSDEMLVASLVGECSDFCEQVAVPQAFAELIRISPVPLHISAGDEEIRYTGGGKHGVVVKDIAPHAVLRLPENAKYTDGVKLTRAIRLALSVFPSIGNQVFYISPEEIVATDRVLLAVVKHQMELSEPVFIHPSHALSVSPSVNRYSVDAGWFLISNGDEVVYNIPTIQGGRKIDTSRFDAPPQFVVRRQDMMTAVGVIKSLTTEPYAVAMNIGKREMVLSTMYSENHGVSVVDISAVATTCEERGDISYSSHYLFLIFQALRGADTVSLAIYGDNDLLQVTATVEDTPVRYTLPPIRFNR